MTSVLTSNMKLCLSFDVEINNSSDFYLNQRTWRSISLRSEYSISILQIVASPIQEAEAAAGDATSRQRTPSAALRMARQSAKAAGRVNTAAAAAAAGGEAEADTSRQRTPSAALRMARQQSAK